MKVREIAAVFGVAPSTVSLVLNGKPGVGDELRKSIEEKLIENGYTIKKEQEERGTILFIYYISSRYLSNRKDNTFAMLLGGVQKVCKQKNYICSLIYAGHGELEEKIREADEKADIRGIVFLGTEYFHSPDKVLLGAKTPLVVLDGFFPDYPLNTVNIDNAYGIYEEVKYLKAKGHRTVGYLRCGLPYGCLQDRRNCVELVLRQMGLQLREEDIVEVTQDTEALEEEIGAYLDRQKQLPTAFIADNDLIGIMAVKTMQARGLRVPEDISVIGFDDAGLCQLSTPKLTTVRADFEKMGERAVYRLLRMMEEKDKCVEKLYIGTEFIERESVARIGGSE